MEEIDYIIRRCNLLSQSLAQIFHLDQYLLLPSNSFISYLYAPLPTVLHVCESHGLLSPEILPAITFISGTYEKIIGKYPISNTMIQTCIYHFSTPLIVNLMNINNIHPTYISSHENRLKTSNRPEITYNNNNNNYIIPNNYVPHINIGYDQYIDHNINVSYGYPIINKTPDEIYLESYQKIPTHLSGNNQHDNDAINHYPQPFINEGFCTRQEKINQTPENELDDNQKHKENEIYEEIRSIDSMSTESLNTNNTQLDSLVKSDNHPEITVNLDISHKTNDNHVVFETIKLPKRIIDASDEFNFFSNQIIENISIQNNGISIHKEATNALKALLNIKEKNENSIEINKATSYENVDQIKDKKIQTIVFEDDSTKPNTNNNETGNSSAIIINHEEKSETACNEDGFGEWIKTMISEGYIFDKDSIQIASKINFKNAKQIIQQFENIKSTIRNPSSWLVDQCLKTKRRQYRNKKYKKNYNGKTLSKEQSVSKAINDKKINNHKQYRKKYEHISNDK